MKKKTVALITSYVLSALLVLGGFVYVNFQTAETYKRYLTNSHNHAFSEFVNSMNQIDASLQKSLYATSPSMVCAVCTDVFGKSMSAQQALGELPFSDYGLEQTSSFISKVGDYAYLLSRKAAGGKSYSDEEYQNLIAISETASVLSDNFAQLLTGVNDGSVTISELGRSRSAAELDESASAMLGDNIKTMESEFPDLPSLIYDGPFSEHILQMKPRSLEGAGQIDETGALSAAADFLGCDKKDLTVGGTREGNLPAYMICSQSGGCETSVEVSVQGGVVLNLTNSRIINKAALSAEDAVGIAKRFLQKQGYKSMTESYWLVHNNTATVNFAYVQDDVICYPDLVKVSVALDNGGIVGFDSAGYVMSHVRRDIPAPVVPDSEARSLVAGDLHILSHSMTVIPTEGKNEVFCHEYKCENGDGSHYIIYVNAVTGVEQKILILLEDENGTLTI